MDQLSKENSTKPRSVTSGNQQALSRCAGLWVISVSPIPRNSLTSVASSALTRNSSMQRAISGHAGQRRIGDEGHQPRRVRFG